MQSQPGPRLLTLAQKAGALLAVLALLMPAAPADACTHDSSATAQLVAPADAHGEAHDVSHGEHDSPVADSCEHCDGAAHGDACEQHCSVVAAMIVADGGDWRAGCGIERVSAPSAALSGILQSAEPPPPRA